MNSTDQSVEENEYVQPRPKQRSIHNDFSRLRTIFRNFVKKKFYDLKSNADQQRFKKLHGITDDRWQEWKAIYFEMVRPNSGEELAVSDD